MQFQNITTCWSDFMVHITLREQSFTLKVYIFAFFAYPSTHGHLFGKDAFSGAFLEKRKGIIIRLYTINWVKKKFRYSPKYILFGLIWTRK